jgi:hypothetical protein
LHKVLEDPNQILDMYPREPLLAITNYSDRPALNTIYHLDKCSTVTSQHNPEAAEHHPAPGFRGSQRCRFPLVGHLGQEVVAGFTTLVKNLITMKAIIADG